MTHPALEAQLAAIAKRLGSARFALRLAECDTGDAKREVRRLESEFARLAAKVQRKRKGKRR